MATLTPNSNPIPGFTEPGVTTTPSLEFVGKFDKNVFAQRLQQMVDLTGGYDGTLQETWEKSRANEIASSGSTTGSELGKDQKREVDHLAKKIRNTGMASVVIEAAHTYMYENLDDERLRGSIQLQSGFAAAVADRLTTDGITVRQILFVDDYNPDPEKGSEGKDKLDIAALIDLTNATGYMPELLLREGDMVPIAKSMMSFMQDNQDLVVSSSGASEEIGEKKDVSGSRLFLARKNIELYRAGDDMLSCAMLDAALTVLKLRYLGETVLNVLPRNAKVQHISYNNQQRKMRTIVSEHLQLRTLPVFNLFTGSRERAEDIAAGAHNEFRKRH